MKLASDKCLFKHINQRKNCDIINLNVILGSVINSETNKIISDIFPTGDLGVRKGFKMYFKLKEIPDHETMLSKAKIWKPYRTIMGMYFWKVVDSSIEW